MDTTPQSTLPRTLDRIATLVMALLVFLLPLFFVPFPEAPFQFGKTMLAVLLGTIALCLFVWARIKEGTITVVRHPIVIAVWGLVFAYLLSSLFSQSSAESLLGTRFDVDTVGFFALGALLLSLVAFLVERPRQHLLFFAAFALSALLLVVFELVHVLTGGDFTSFGIFNTPLSNPLGKWNDVALFFGGTVLLVLFALEGFPGRSRAFSVCCYVLFFAALSVLAIVDFSVVWGALLVAGAGFFVYTLYRSRFDALAGDDARREGGYGVMALSVILVAASVLFLFTPFGSSLSASLGIAQVEARPSWGSTVAVLEQTYRTDALFGSGPNTFSERWAAVKPSPVNLTPFWNADFAAGVGQIPTSFITTGLVGGIAWILLLGGLLFFGIKTAFSLVSPHERFARFLALSWFVLSAYFFLMAALYTPTSANILLAFLFAGLFVAAFRLSQSEGEGAFARTISFLASPGLGFIAVLSMVVLAGAGLFVLYASAERYIAAYSFERGMQAFRVEGSLELAKERLIRAARLVPSDQYSRALAEVSVAQLADLVAKNPDPSSAVREEFRAILSEAVSYAVSARDVNPNLYHNWLTAARVYAAVVPFGITGAYESAEAALGRAGELAPQNPQIDLERARLAVAQGDGEAARASIASALRKKNNYTEAVFLLAQLEVDEGNVAGAIQSAEAAVVLEPNNPVVPFQLGILYYQSGAYENASAAFERAVSLDENYANARYFLGLSYYARGLREEAVAQFEAVALLNPDNDGILTMLRNLRAGLPPDAPEGDPAGLPIEE